MKKKINFLNEELSEFLDNGHSKKKDIIKREIFNNIFSSEIRHFRATRPVGSH